MNRLPFLSQRLLNTPLAIHPMRAEVILAALSERIGIASFTRIEGEKINATPVALGADEFCRGNQVAALGYETVAGVAVIPVCGTLVQKLGSIEPVSGMQGYDAIRGAFLCALEDDEVEAIVLDTDSGGGEVAGLFDLVDEIYEARGQKPIWAILSECAYSAAYALASAADYVTVPRTGGTGSVGVVAAHVDYSKALTAAGLAVTFIQYGARKIDGVPEKPLSDEALAHIQRDVDFLGEMFCETVARNRKLAVSKVKAMQAATFMGAEGVSAGLADQTLSADRAFQSLLDKIG